MSKFEHLRKLYSEKNSAFAEYWHNLRGCAGQIRKGFSDFLKLPEEEYYLQDSSTTLPYVTLSKGASADYEQCRVQELEQDGRFLNFCLGVTVDKAPNQYPKDHIFIDIQIKNENDTYVVVVAEEVVVINSTANPDFTPVYEQVYAVLERYFSARP